MPSLTVENYVKAILQIGIRKRSASASTGELAEALHVSPGTVTSMLKTLAESDLASYKPYEGVRLTPAGKSLALRMLRRHRLIELFLVQTLDLSWDQVHEEAENMEHAVSDNLVDRIDEFLGHPEFDPHGDPIPGADGDMRGSTDSAVPLSSCAVGDRTRIVRVVNQDSEFLRYLADSGLQIGTEGTVTQNQHEAGVVAVETVSGSVIMGQQAAEKVLVEMLASDSPID